MPCIYSLCTVTYSMHCVALHCFVLCVIQNQPLHTRNTLHSDKHQNLFCITAAMRTVCTVLLVLKCSNPSLDAPASFHAQHNWAR